VVTPRDVDSVVGGCDRTKVTSSLLSGLVVGRHRLLLSLLRSLRSLGSILGVCSPSGVNVPDICNAGLNPVAVNSSRRERHSRAHFGMILKR
jgi:hypothetical protein